MSKNTQLKKIGEAVIDALSDSIKWKFDDFNQAWLAEFSVDKEDQVMLILQQILPVVWDAKSIKNAPEEIKHLAGSYAKLSKKQKLLSVALGSSPKFMVAWWPWGHGATVSVRLFATNQQAYVPKRRFTQVFKNLFAS